MTNYGPYNTSHTWPVKYYAEFKNERSEEYRIEICEKDATLSSSVYPQQMGDITGVQFKVQGDQDDATAPIIKTSLQISLCDTWDETSAGTAGSVKHGNWTEFFTPDSTKYLVKLYQKINGTNTLRWSGYITPDSWEESLDYRDSITITARDNIGHLSDIDCDAYPSSYDSRGLVTIKDLITDALAAIEFPMTIIWAFEPEFDGGNFHHCMYWKDLVTNTWRNSNTIAAYVRDKGSSEDLELTWAEMLEHCLDSLGLTLRYVDNNQYIVAPIRDLYLLSKDRPSQVTRKELEFYGGGQLRLVPAYREIVDKMDYDQDTKIEFDGKGAVKFTGASGSYGYTSGYWYSQSSQTKSGSAPCYAVKATQSGQMGWGILSGYGFLNPDAFELTDETLDTEGDGAKEYLFMVANQAHEGASNAFGQTFKVYVNSTNLTATFEWAEHPMARFATGSTPAYKLHVAYYNLYQIKYKVRYVKDGTTYYWNGSLWTTTDPGVLTKEYDSDAAETTLEIQLLECEAAGANGILYFDFYHIKYFALALYPGQTYNFPDGCYARLKTVTLENKNTTLLKTDTVTTVNNDSYNVKLKREPEYGAAKKLVQFITPKNYPKALYIWGSSNYPALLAYEAYWDSSIEDNIEPLAACIHRQHLLFHHVAMRQLDGGCGPADHTPIRFDQQWSYKNQKYLLLSATLDLFTGRFSSAVFNQFLTWNELWGTAPEIYCSLHDIELVNQELKSGTVETSLAWTVDSYESEYITLNRTSGPAGTSTLTITAKSSVASTDFDTEVDLKVEDEDGNYFVWTISITHTAS